MTKNKNFPKEKDSEQELKETIRKLKSQVRKLQKENKRIKSELKTYNQAFGKTKDYLEEYTEEFSLEELIDLAKKEVRLPKKEKKIPKTQSLEDIKKQYQKMFDKNKEE